MKSLLPFATPGKFYRGNIHTHSNQSDGALAPETVVEDASEVPFGKALAIGLIQCLSMIPGISRSGATIVGARMLGVSRRGGRPRDCR